MSEENKGEKVRKVKSTKPAKTEAQVKIVPAPAAATEAPSEKPAAVAEPAGELVAPQKSPKKKVEPTRLELATIDYLNAVEGAKPRPHGKAVAGAWVRKEREAKEALEAARDRLYAEVMGALKVVYSPAVPLPVQSEIREEEGLVVDLADLYEALSVRARASTRSSTWSANQATMVLGAWTDIQKTFDSTTGIKPRIGRNSVFPQKRTVVSPETERRACIDILEYRHPNRGAQVCWVMSEIFVQFLLAAEANPEHPPRGPVYVLVTSPEDQDFVKVLGQNLKVKIVAPEADAIFSALTS